MKNNIPDIDNSQGKFKTPLSSEDGRTYNRTWEQQGIPTITVSFDNYDLIFRKGEYANMSDEEINKIWLEIENKRKESI